MGSKPSLFRVSDPTRLCESILRAGLVPARVRVLPDGTIEADIAQKTDLVDGEGNEWDDELNPNGQAQ